jgi:hypothetical protein
VKANELFYEDGRSAGVFACGKCRLIHTHRDLADRCCEPYICPHCGKPVEEKHRTAHHDCTEKDKISKAEKLEAWDGWVYLDGHGYRDGYFLSLDELIEYLDDEEIDPRPEWAFLCQTMPFKGPDIGNIIEQCCDDMYEDAEDSLSGLDELEVAIKEFNEANKGTVSYYPDYKRAVRIPVTS